MKTLPMYATRQLRRDMLRRWVTIRRLLRMPLNNLSSCDDWGKQLETREAIRKEKRNIELFTLGKEGTR